MRKIFLIITILFCAVSAFSQRLNQEDVPAVVLNSFQIKFPHAKNAKWNLHKGNYFIDCRINSKENLVTLSRNGSLIKHKQDLYISEIPKRVIQVIEERLSYYDVHDADKLWENGKAVYVIKFKNDSKDRIFWIGEKGNLIKYRKVLASNEVPESVLGFINKKFGNIDVDRAKYLEESNRIFYLVDGEINNEDHKFWISNKLTLIEHRHDLNYKNIPVPILKTLESKYSGYSVRDADLVYKNNTTTYTVRIKTNNKTVNVVLSPKGKVLRAN